MAQPLTTGLVLTQASDWVNLGGRTTIGASAAKPTSGIDGTGPGGDRSAAADINPGTVLIQRDRVVPTRIPIPISRLVTPAQTGMFT
jgi:hypothetical protein